MNDIEKYREAGELPRRAIEDIFACAFSVFIKGDNATRLLRLHALTEFYMDRILYLILPNPDPIFTQGRFTYFQKLQLVTALGALPADVIESLQRVSKLRNKLAHNAFPQVSVFEIEQAAQPIEEQYQLTLDDQHTDGLPRDEMGALAWALFSEITLRIGPLEDFVEHLEQQLSC